MGTLEAPQDTHGQDKGQGPPERNRQTEAKAELGALEAMAGGLRGRGLVPRPSHYSQNPSTPPKKIHGADTGYQEPSMGYTRRNTTLK